MRSRAAHLYCGMKMVLRWSRLRRPFFQNHGGRQSNSSLVRVAVSGGGAAVYTVFVCVRISRVREIRVRPIDEELERNRTLARESCMGIA